MRDFFRRFDGATWLRGQRLHIYLTPPDELRAAVREYQDALESVETGSIGLQPLGFLHFTVQMLNVHRDEMETAVLNQLIQELQTDVGRVNPFTLDVGPPQPSEHAIELWVSSNADPHWVDLIDHVRNAVTRVLGSSALPPVGPNATPHSSLAYGAGDGDSGRLTHAIKSVRFPIITVPVNTVDLVAVDQHPREGQFSWTHIAKIPLATKKSSPGGSPTTVGTSPRGER